MDGLKSLASLFALCGVLGLAGHASSSAAAEAAAGDIGRAGDAAEPYIVVRLYSGLEFRGELKQRTEDNLVVHTPYGDRTLRRTDIVQTRMQLAPEERTELRGLLAYAAKSAAAASAEAAAAARMGQPAREPDPAQRVPGIAARGDFARGDFALPGGGNFNAGPGPNASAYERMYRALDQKVTLDFVDTPLTDAIDFLNALTHCNIVISPKVRENKPTVSLRVNEMDAGTVLKWLAQLTQTYAEVKDQAIWITDQPSKEAVDEERQGIMLLAASMHATVDLPPEGVPLTDTDRTKIALQLWEKEQPKVTDFPGPDLSIGADREPVANPFAAGPGQ